MAFDYDLTILGTTGAAITGAIAAVNQQARVALVSQTPADQPLQSTRWPWVQHQRLVRSLHNVPPNFSPASSQDSFDKVATLATAQRFGQVWAVANTLESLALAGVDVIHGKGQFLVPRRPKSPVALQVGERILRSRVYLLALPSITQIPPIPGLETVDYLTPQTLGQTLTALPHHCLILGGSPYSLELAQVLTRLGHRVTWITPTPYLLTGEDPELINLLRIQLLNQGIHLVCNATINKVEQQGQQQGQTITLETSQGLLTGNALVVAGKEGADFGRLNLEALGITIANSSLQANAYLRTAHPQVYACGTALGGYGLPHVADYEARLAVTNGLFWPRKSVNYPSIPYTIFTDPPLARVGLTEPQARQRYGSQVRVLRVPLYTNLEAQLQDQTLGLCKVLALANGQILGAHWFGAGATEGIALLALALQQNLKLPALADYPMVSPSLGQVVQGVVEQWQREERDDRGWYQNLLRLYFNWRRTGNL
jgi:pyruvate/2-oxoglutarate dehydrogenase complex dihydrolipoamide dehydrogenase (E3) component